MARPAEFDRQDVLEKAMNVFWRTGYSATSINDLVNATNLKPGSLYGAFQSKRDLFLEVIDTYAHRSLERVSNRLSESDAPLENIESFFERFANDLVNDEIGQGCLLVNTMLELATEDDDVRSRVSNYLDQVELCFKNTLTEAQTLGQLDKSKDPEVLATFLMTTIWGLRVLSSKRPDRNAFAKVIQQTLSTLHYPSH